MNNNEKQEIDILEKTKEDFQKLNIEYLAVQELVKEKQRKVASLRLDYEKIDSRIFDLDNYRNNLNTSIRKQRKEVKETEAYLSHIKSQLAKYESAVIDARKNVEKARRDAKPFMNQWQSANSELQDLEKTLALAYEKLKAAQKEYLLAGGKLTSEEKTVESPETILKESQNNPWKSGTFYLFAFLVIIAVIVLLLLSLPWYTIGFVVIAALLLLVIIGALQLRNDKNLSDESFLQLMLEVLKKLPFLKKV